MSETAGNHLRNAAHGTAPELDHSPSAAGLSQGEFAVDASGQATFRIPLEVPPGIAGLVPKLELAYGHRRPNGILGVGWSCGGLSAITRIKATYAVDGFNGAIAYDANDRFSLDGQRLINVKGNYGQSGTVYYTALQSWNHVQEKEGGFVVTTKQGTTMEYGMTPDSRILAAGGGHVRVWALCAVADRNGNRVEYSYTPTPASGAVSGDPTDDAGAYYLTQIRYTVRRDAAPKHFVDFRYEARPDPIANYVGGYPVTVSRRLKQITTATDTVQGRANIRAYTIEYETGKATGFSRIVSITEASAAGDGLAFVSTKIVWQDTNTPGFDTGSPVSTLARPGSSGLLPMDITGSGRTDFVQLWQDDPVLHANTYLATPGPEGLQFQFAADSVLDAFPQTRQVMPVDLDGDGRTDLLVAFQDPIDNTLKLAAYLSDGEGFTAADNSPFATGEPWDPASHIRFFAMDANGDGRTDLVEAFAQDGRLCFRTFLSRFGEPSSPGFAPAIYSATVDPAYPADEGAFWAMDVNGDGMMDLVRVWRDTDFTVHATAYVSVGNAIDQVTFATRVDTKLDISSLADRSFLPVDVNGDGIQDLLHIWRDADGTTLHFATLLSKANGSFVAGPDTSFPNQTIDLEHLYPMGLTGGGQVALVSPWVTTGGLRSFSIFLGSPSGAFRVLPPTPPFAAPPDAYFYLGDPDGNGKADLIQASLNTDNIVELVPYLSTGPYNDLASSITNGVGGTVSIKYAPLSDPGVYTAGETTSFPAASACRYPNPLTPTQFPVQSVLGQALYVVSSFCKQEDPAANRFPYTFSFAMDYSDAQVNLLGRGWQSFRRVRTTSLESGRVSSVTYNQAFPYTGTVAEHRTEVDGRHASDPRVPRDKTALLRKVVTTYGVYPPKPGPVDGQRVVEVLPTSSQRAEYDYGEENFDFQTGQSFEYDEFGNVSRHVNWGYVDRVSGKPLFPDEVVYRYNLYQNDVFPEGGWALGFLRYAKTSANAADPDAARFLPGDLRLEQRTYAAATYNLASRAHWDDANNVYLATSYDYDAYGNRRSETAPGGYLTRYDYDPDYHTFPMTVTFPANDQGLSLVSSHGYDPRFGVEVARRERNGSIFITALDGLGRKSIKQGPIPDNPGAVGDPNALTRMVSGSPELRQLFLDAPTVTVETTAYLNDGQGGHCTETRSLQRFPDGPTREFLSSRSYIDGLGREREGFHQAGPADRNIVVVTDYDAHGNPLQQSLPFFSATAKVAAAPHAIVTRYDVLGRRLERREPAGRDGNDFSVTSWTYARDGLVTETQAAGSAVAYTQIQEHHLYDSKDKVRRVVVPSDGNATTRFQFDRLGRLVQSTDAATAFNPHGVTNTTTYDSLDRPLTVDNPDQNTTGDPNIKAARYEYDPLTGHLRRQTDASQQAVTYSYDATGRITGQALHDGSLIARIYDEGGGGGHLTQVSVKNADHTVQSQYVLGYDRYGNTCETTLVIEGEPAPFVTTSVFDPQRRVVREALPDGSAIVRQYASGRLVGLVLGDVRVAYPLDHYHPTGKPGRLVYGQGAVEGGSVVAELEFNPAGLPYRETLANGSGTFLDESYQYDLLRQILRIGADASAGPAKTFAYVNRRLTSATIPGLAPAAYDYDASGNLTAKDGVRYDFRAHFAVSGTMDGAEVYSASVDACGRTRARTAKGITQDFEYDGLGCLKSVAASDGKSISRMLNDYRGRRLREAGADGTTTIFVHPAYQVTRAADGSLSVTHYLRDDLGPVAAVTSGGGARTRYMRRDHKGIITHLFDTEGALASVVAYGGYGEFTLLKGGADSGPKYEGRPWDSSAGLYCFGARYYDPVSGRFLTPDTVPGGANLLQAGVLNRYAFELNNPIVYVDPSGHLPAWAYGLILGGLVIAAGVATLGIFAGVGAIAATAGWAATATAMSITGGVVGGAAVGAGVAAIGYSANHTNNSFSWTNYGIETGVGAGIGALTGLAMPGIGALTANLGWRAGLAWSAALTGAANAGLDVGGQLVTNAAEGNPLKDGLLQSAVFGFVFGAAAGALGFGIGRAIAGRVVNRSAAYLEGLDARGEPIITDPFGNPFMLEERLIEEQEYEAALEARLQEAGRAVLKRPLVQLPQQAVSFVTSVPEAYLENTGWWW
jgi:RHS repeat-associated protein